MTKLIRTEFLKLISATALIAGSLSLGCGDDGGQPMIDAAPMIDGPAGCSATMAKVTIADNHVHAPHALVVSSADVQAGVAKTYDIMGAASHNHTVAVTAADFTTLKGGGMVMILSSDNNGTHLVTISCA